MAEIAAATASGVPRLAVKGLTKRFGPVVANEGITLAVQPGELYCLLGENGAGKSTLSACLYGLYQPDEGTIEVDGRPLQLKSPLDAIGAGIGMVHQHFVLVPRFSVIENIAVGTGRGLRLKLGAARRRLEELCERFAIRLDPDARVGDLCIGEQQWVEILKALCLDARILILDEPTAVLTPEESQRLFAMIRHLTGSGISVVLITHKMNEVMQCDRVAVLRRGRLVASRAVAQTNRDELTTLMVGRPIVPPCPHPSPAPERSAIVLDVNRIGLRRGGRDRLNRVTLTVRSGEIVGIAGVAGNGQDELFAALAGIEAPDRGTVSIDGMPTTGMGAREVAELGVGYVPNDRFRDGLVPDFTIAENVVLGSQWQNRLRNGPFLDLAAMQAAGEAAIDAYAIAGAPGIAARRLSGGNAQKVILAREFAKARRLLLCNQPTRGLDVGVTEFVHAEIVAKRDAGCAVLIASEEMEDLIALCDHIAVMFEGEVLDILPRDEADAATIGRLMAGHQPADERHAFA